MLTYYQSERLELRILKPDSSSAVLDFYERNRNTLEPVEPLRPQYFYTITYQSRNLTWEYNAFLKSKYIRYWMFRKKQQYPDWLCLLFRISGRSLSSMHDWIQTGSNRHWQRLYAGGNCLFAAFGRKTL